MKRYLKKMDVIKLRAEFTAIEVLAEAIGNHALINAVNIYKKSMIDITDGFIYSQKFNVPEDINMDGIAYYDQLPNVKESVKK